jgi:hypothetical protein
MLTMHDCIALSELTEDEILAIAEHEGIPEMAAAELGNYLVQTPDGEARIEHMIIDDIEAAKRCRDPGRAATLRITLQLFVAHHAHLEQQRSVGES